MKLDALKPLLHHDGPLTTVVLEATHVSALEFASLEELKEHAMTSEMD